MYDAIKDAKSRDEQKQILSKKTFKNRDTDSVLYPYRTLINDLGKNPNSFMFGSTKYQTSNNQVVKEYLMGNKTVEEVATHLYSGTKSDNFRRDTKDLISSLNKYEEKKNAKWSPAQEELITQRTLGEISEDTFNNEITKFKYGEFNEFHEPLLKEVQAKKPLKFGYEPTGENKKEYKKYLEENAGKVNRATLNQLSKALMNNDLVLRNKETHKTEADPKKIKEMSTYVEHMRSAYIDKGVLPNDFHKIATPEDLQIERNLFHQIKSTKSKFNDKWVHKGNMDDRSVVSKLEVPDVNENFKAIEMMDDVEQDVSWKYFHPETFKTKTEKMKLSTLNNFKDYVKGKDLFKQKGITTLDSRGRNYQNVHKPNDYTVINPIANQDIKQVRAMISFSDKQQVNDLDEFKIHTANQWGLDKKPYADRVKWFDENEDLLKHMISKADEPAMAERAVDEWEKVKNHQPTGMVAYADAVASGVQIKAALHNDPLSLNFTGATNKERPDIYAHVVNSLNRLNIIDKKIKRSVAKEAIMQGGYGSSQAGKIIVFNTYKNEINKARRNDTKVKPRNLTPKIFNDKRFEQFRVPGLSDEASFIANKDKILERDMDLSRKRLDRKEMAKGAKILKNTGIYPSLKPYAEKAELVKKYYEDTLRNESRFNSAIMDSVDYKQDFNTMHMPDLRKAVGINREFEFENTLGSRNFAANYTHSFDAWITREMVNAGQLDKSKLMGLKTNMIGQRKPLSDKTKHLLDYYDKSGYLSNYVLNDLTPGEYNSLSNTHREKVNSIIANLPDKNYKLKLVHDSFGTHPNNMKDVKQQYTNIIEGVFNTKGKLLKHTFKEWTGKHLPYQISDHSSEGLFEKGNYLIN